MIGSSARRPNSRAASTGSKQNTWLTNSSADTLPLSYDHDSSATQLRPSIDNLSRAAYTTKMGGGRKRTRRMAIDDEELHQLDAICYGNVAGGSEAVHSELSHDISATGAEALGDNPSPVDLNNNNQSSVDNEIDENVNVNAESAVSGTPKQGSEQQRSTRRNNPSSGSGSLLPREVQQLFNDSFLLNDNHSNTRSTRGSRKNYAEYGDEFDDYGSVDYEGGRRGTSAKQFSTRTTSSSSRYNFRHGFSDDDEDEVDAYAESSVNNRSQKRNASFGSRTSARIATLSEKRKNDNLLPPVDLEEIKNARMTRRTAHLLEQYGVTEGEEYVIENGDKPRDLDQNNEILEAQTSSGRKRLVRGPLNDSEQNFGEDEELLTQGRQLRSRFVKPGGSSKGFDDDEDNFGERQYSLRNRDKKINYVVRIPLHGASPKKNERRRPQSKFPRRDFETFGQRFGGNGLASFISGPRFHEHETDDEFSPGKDTRRLAGLSSDIKPLNSLKTEDIDRFILSRKSGPSGKNLTDSDPIEIDPNIDFSSVGGLSDHIKSLKEMVVLPLLYPEMFSKFSLSPPRGVLFYGPPGTGKTLIARALANVCSKQSQKVSFFMRKGADVLSKWVGESERQLKALFEQARLMQPSIIFFDEIDGLAPVRSAKQDQIHSSIVTTLLALMDGLDTRGQVVVIGATNRIDSVDPALRRPGRFDREMFFPLPNCEARLEILRIHTKNWNPPLNEETLSLLAENTPGYGGSDLKSLCTEAALRALDRTFPEVYYSEIKLEIDLDRVLISKDDFLGCMRKIVPSSYRWKDVQAKPLVSYLRPLLQFSMDNIYKKLELSFPFLARFPRSMSSIVSRPRLLLSSERGNECSLHLAAALLSEFETINVNILSIGTLFTDSSLSPEAALVQFSREAKRRLPSVIFVPDIEHTWESFTPIMKRIFLDFMHNQISSTDSLLLMATTSSEELDEGLMSMFADTRCREIVQFGACQIAEFFQFVLASFTNLGEIGIIFDEESNVFMCSKKKFLLAINAAPVKSTDKVLIPAAQLPPKKLTKDEIKLLREYDFSMFRRLRMLLREFLMDLIRSKDYKALSKGINSVEDYPQSLKYDFHDLLDRVESLAYFTLKSFKQDLMETLDGFGQLAAERNEYYRLSYIYSLADYVEEWFISVDKNFVAEVNESAAREKRLKEEYEELAKESEAVDSASFRINKRMHLYGSGPSSADTQCHNNEDDDQSLENETSRTSRRLKGEEPIFDSSALVVRTRRTKIIVEDGTDVEDHHQHDEQSGDGEEVDEEVSIISPERGAEDSLNDASTEDQLKTVAEEPSQMESLADRDQIVEETTELSAEAHPNQIPPIDSMDIVQEEVVESIVIEEVEEKLSIAWVRPVNSSLSDRLVQRYQHCSLSELEQLRSVIGHICNKWKESIVTSVKAYLENPTLEQPEIDLMGQLNLHLDRTNPPSIYDL